MISRLITFLLAAIIAILLTSRGVNAEDKNNKNVTEIMFHVPPTLKNGAVPEYNTWLNLRPAASDRSTDDEDIFHVMRHHPQFAGFFNIIHDYVDMNELGSNGANNMYTIFAPIVNDISYWKKMPDIKEAIQYHVLVGQSYDLGSLEDGKKYLAGSNGPIVYELKSGHLQVDCALIIAAPIMTGNGIIYPILKPLKPNIITSVLKAFKAGKSFPCSTI
jgi:uncharacterized surface protein with fasciclin (FAS1) repeats